MTHTYTHKKIIKRETNEVRLNKCNGLDYVHIFLVDDKAIKTVLQN